MCQTVKNNNHITPARKFLPRLLQPAADRLQFAALLLGLLILSFVVRLIFLDNFEWGYDEGIHVLLAQLLVNGHTPYSDLFVSYPPLFIWSLEWPWRIWSAVAAIQLVMTFYSLLGVAAVGLVAFRMEGKLAGVLAACLISFSPIYLDGSRAVMTETPSVGVAALAAALAAIYYWSGQRGWLAASGVAMSASLMLKILSPFMLGLVPLLIVVRCLEQPGQTPARIKQIIIDGLVWGAGLALPLLAVLLVYDAEAMYRQVIAFRIDTRIEYQEDWAENGEMLLMFGRANLPMLLASLWGLGLVLTGRRRAGWWFVPVWLVLAVAFSLIQVPLREKHLPLLLPPLAILAGLGLATGLNRFSRVARQPDLKAAIWSLLALALLLGYLGQLGAEISTISRTNSAPLTEDEWRLVEFIQTYTSPTDCLITDNPTLAFYARRPVPPYLSEVSSARLRSGYLTYHDLVSAATTYNCQVVAPVAKRLQRTRHDFVEWSKANFLALWLYDGSTEIMLAQPLAQAQPAQPTNIRLANLVELAGFEVIEEQESIYVSLYWQALQPIPHDYTIFVHLRNALNNTIILNGDHQPYNNLVPTSRWPAGRIIKETIRLELPPDLAEGEYQIVAGMYSPATGKRLPVQPDASGENAIILQSFTRP